MRRMGAIPILFRAGIDGPIPSEPHVYSLAVQYCQKNLAEVPDFKSYARCYIEAEFGEHGQILEVHGVTCLHFPPDAPVFRVTGPYAKRATVDMYERLNSYLSDLGWRGQDAFIHVSSSENPEQRCENWEETLKELDAKPADRFLVKVR